MDMTDLQADGAQDTEKLTPPPEPRTDRYSEAVAALMPFADHRFVNGKPCRVGTDDGCTCGYHDALTLVDRTEAAGAQPRTAADAAVALLDLLPGTLGDDRAIQRAVDDLVDAARAEAAGSPKGLNSSGTE